MCCYFYNEAALQTTQFISPCMRSLELVIDFAKCYMCLAHKKTLTKYYSVQCPCTAIGFQQLKKCKRRLYIVCVILHRSIIQQHSRLKGKTPQERDSDRQQTFSSKVCSGLSSVTTFKSCLRTRRDHKISDMQSFGTSDTQQQ